MEEVVANMHWSRLMVGMWNAVNLTSLAVGALKGTQLAQNN